MKLLEHVPLAPKTTMRIGGTAKYFVELETEKDIEEVYAAAQSLNLPLLILGGGSNTIFADGEINAVVARLKAQAVTIDGNTVVTETGKILASLINDLAQVNLDLSALTGIPGSVGGAVVGNAGQGPSGTWIDSYVENVTMFDQGKWKTLSREDCHFTYRESVFKHMHPAPIVWRCTLSVPSRPKEEVTASVEALINRRIETQPHLKTAGSCFKAVGKTPAWKLIDKAGLRGTKQGDIEISEKHCNFLMNKGDGKFEDAVTLVEKVRAMVPDELEVEMRFVESDGSVHF